jgi:hypothetical protein
LAVVERSTEPDVLLTVTLAFGIVAPDGSRTNPEIEPKSDCAEAVVAISSAINKHSAVRMEQTWFIFSPEAPFPKALTSLYPF